MRLEVVILPVRDVDRARDFYADQVGFALDVDYAPSPDFRVVQLTPPGSACSIQFGIGLPVAGSPVLQLAVADLAAARDELRGRGVDVGEIRHKAPRETWTGGFEPGLDPERTAYASFADFSDPDGNRWLLQELP